MVSLRALQMGRARAATLAVTLPLITLAGCGGRPSSSSQAPGVAAPRASGRAAPTVPAGAPAVVSSERPGGATPDDETTRFVLDVLARGPMVPSFRHDGPLWEQATRAREIARRGAQLRRQVESPEFAARYRAFREEQARGDELPRPRASRELQDESVSKHEVSLAALKKALEDPDMTAPQRSAFTSLRVAVERALADTKAHPERFDELARLEAEEAQRLERQQQMKRAEVLARLPEDHRRLVLTRLEQVLEQTADVAFDATLVEAAGRRRFADPELEAKGAVWKAGFRAGRPALTAARALASAWIADLRRAGVEPVRSR